MAGLCEDGNEPPCSLKAIRSVPGRSQESRCRHCNEYETLPHVLGVCRKGVLLRNNRHHWVRSQIAECLKKSGKFDIYEEVHCISSTGSTKRADIIAIDNNQKIGFIIDPTIRFEGAEFQPQEVDLEKKRHYEPCFPYLEEKYRIPVCRWEVIGLLFEPLNHVDPLAGSRIHFEFIPEGRTISKETYVAILRHLRDAVGRKTQFVARIIMKIPQHTGRS
ncbi:hypothetical protein ANN_20741 [Periplaneta americana]|uniref:Reverse transcriptase n=1 Tax=Periplaneta americana TaxID=6978 RepID=A0ABQ8SE79_PERAM|nr:hypothetical protein ANN_20741 [Periplaneta americana]